MSDERAAPPPEPGDGLEIFDAPPAVPAEPAETAARPEPPASLDARIAHPALRALAFVLDGLGTVAATIIAVFAALFAEFDGFLGGILVVPLLSAALATVLTAFLGVTPGKAIVGLRVVDAETGRVTGGWAVLRSLVIVAPLVLTWLAAWVAVRLPDGGGLDLASPGLMLLPVAMWVALLVVLAVRPRHRGLQDLAGRSVVVRR